MHCNWNMTFGLTDSLTLGSRFFHIIATTLKIIASSRGLVHLET